MFCMVDAVLVYMFMFTYILLTVLTAISGEDKHTMYSEGEGHLLSGGVCPSSLQVIVSQEHLQSCSDSMICFFTEYQTKSIDKNCTRFVACACSAINNTLATH